MDRVARWVAQNYPRPTIDQAWLSDCGDWISSAHNITPSTHFEEFVARVEEQLLQSNLEDSTVPGTGLDPQLVQAEDRPSRTRSKPSSRANRKPQGQRRKKVDTGPTPLLVEIRAITEIAHSALTLLNTHQTRLDRADLGLARDDGNQQDPHQQDEEEGPVPRFPRGMLRFELSDGHTRFRAIEYRSMPDLVLGETPLGYKMLLTSAPIRNGVAFLQPSNVTLKGYQTEDHDAHREQVFLSGLRKRLGRPDPPEANVQQRAQPQPAQAAPLIPPQPGVAPPRQHQPTRAPSPPPDLDDMYMDDDIDPEMLDVFAQMETNAVGPTALSGRTLIGSGAPTQPMIRSGPNTEMEKPLTIAQQQKSPYFSSSAKEKTGPSIVPDIGLSPTRAQPSREDKFDITWDSDESEAFRAFADDPSTKTHVTVKVTSAPEPRSPIKSTHNEAARSRTAGKGANLVPPRSKGPGSTSASTSTDLYDSFSMDLDVDDDFLAEVERAEQQALASAAGSGFTSQTCQSGQTKRENIIRISSTPSSQLRTSDRNVNLQDSRSHTALLGLGTGKRARSTSDIGSSSTQQHADLCPPPSTQPPRAGPSNRRDRSPCRPPPSRTKPTKRRLTRDQSVIIISSSDSETENSESDSAPQSQAPIKLERRGESGDRDMLDVINISD